MSEVKRYFADLVSNFDQLPVEYLHDVQVVLASDYDAFAAECERLREKCRRLDEKYDRDVWGLNNEGDAIGGEPAGGYANELRRAVGERDAALAELAALKGGREAVEYQQLSRYGNWDRIGKVDFDLGLLGACPEKFRALYTAPPAQASAWVAVSERMPESGRTVLAYYLNSHGKGRRIRAQHIKAWTVESECVSDPDTECVEYSEQMDAYYLLEGWYECIDNWDDYTRIAVNEGPISHWQPLPAAPTPGASDGKGGE